MVGDVYMKACAKCFVCLMFQMPHDAHLLRFLRARDFNTEKAHEMITASLAWRKQHQVDKILKSWEAPEILKKFFPGSWQYHDRGNKLIVYSGDEE